MNASQIYQESSLNSPISALFHSFSIKNDAIPTKIEYPTIDESDPVADLESRFTIKDLAYFEENFKCCEKGCCAKAHQIDKESLQARCCAHEEGCECEKPFGFIPRCSLCDQPAAAIHMKWCLEEASKASPQEFTDLFDLQNSKVFVCSEHAQECCSEFKNLDSWTENLIEVISRLELMSKDISYTLSKRLEDFDKVISATEMRAKLVEKYFLKYNSSSSASEKNEIAGKIEFLLNSPVTKILENLETENFFSEESPEIAPLNDIFVARINDFIVSFAEQIDSLIYMKNVSIEASNFVFEVLPKIMTPMKNVLKNPETPAMLRLCVVAWVVSHYKIIGTYLLNRIPVLIPNAVLRGESISSSH